MSLEETFVTELATAVDAAVVKAEASRDSEPVKDATPAKVIEPDKVAEPDKAIEPVKVMEPDKVLEPAKVLESEKVVESEKVIEPAKIEISDAVTVRAIYAGLSPEDIRAFGSEAALNRVLDNIEATQRATMKVVEPEKDDPLAILPPLDPDVYDAESIKMYDGLVAVIKKQQAALDSMQSHQKQSVQAGQRRAAHDVEVWFDGQVAKLGKDFSESLGEGNYSSLKRGSSQLAKRDELANQVAVLMAGYKASGQKSPSREDVFDAAARLVLKDEHLKAHEKRLSSDLDKRSKQHIARAGGQQDKSKLSPVDEIAGLLDAKYFPKQ